MDAVMDAVSWHDCAFVRTASGSYWRVFFGGEPYPFIERLMGNEPEWVEPLNELKRRLSHYGEKD